MHPKPTHSRLESGSQLALLGAGINAALALLKVAAGIWGNSYALIADGVESTLDIFSSILVWAGLRWAAIPPDDSHPYGHGKAETLASIAVALLLLGTSVGLAIQSIQDILTPHHKPSLFTLPILLGIVVVKEILYRKFQTHSASIGSNALATDAWHHRSDAITSAAAFIGISLAVLGGNAWNAADGYAALVACGVIAFNGIRILGPALNEAMDTAPPPHVEKAVRLTASTVPGVQGVEKCRIRKMGIEYYVDLHVIVPGEMSVREGHAIAHAVKDAIRADLSFIADVLVHIEPA